MSWLLSLIVTGLDPSFIINFKSLAISYGNHCLGVARKTLRILTMSKSPTSLQKLRQTLRGREACGSLVISQIATTHLIG